MNPDGIFNFQVTAQGCIKEFLNGDLKRSQTRKMQFLRLSETAKNGEQEWVSETFLWSFLFKAHHIFWNNYLYRYGTIYK